MSNTDPLIIKNMMRLGNIKIQLKDFDAALDFYRQALELK